MNSSEAFLHGSIVDKSAFCVGEKQGMLANDECTCSSWYNRVGDFYHQFVIGENSLCMSMDQHTWSDKTTSLQSVWLVELSAMMVECE